MEIDIVIPAHNQAAFTLKCLRSIREFTKNYRVIFVDNGSNREELKQVKEELENHPYLLIQNTRNLGFVKAVNQGLSVITAPYVVLLNNDTKVVPDWIEKLKFPLVAESQIAACGPVTTAIDCWQGREKMGDGYRVLPRSAMLAFFCILIKREAIEKVGLLDENFGVGLGDDDDYCMRLKKAGYKLALAQDLLIPHYHRTTFKSLYTESQIKTMTETGIAYFFRKHTPID
jgi:GT2 family glycosyltransferase